MGPGAVVIAFLFTAIGTNILMFPLAALAIRGHRKAPLPWGAGLSAFGVACLLVSIYFGALDATGIRPLFSREISGLRMVLDHLVPLVVCVLTLWVMWRPKPRADAI